MTSPPGVLVIDVSELQGPIDWPVVAAWRSDDGRAIEAVVARATLGQTRDSRFRENRAGARGVGLLFGAYGVIRPAGDAAAQARAFVDTVGRVESDELPPCCDFELEDGKSGGDGEHAAALVWVEAVEAALHRRCTIYTGRWFWQVIGDRPTSPLATRPLWVASYTRAPLVPRAWSRWAIWQHSGDGGERVAGIRTDVDRDVFADDTNGDGQVTRADLLAFIEASRIAVTVEVAPGAASNPAPLLASLQATPDPALDAEKDAT